jgi:membrane associated rhomboid family serine protease
MGFENRDYYRDGSYTASLADWGVDFTPVVKYLILANIAVFLLQIFITRPPEPPPPAAPSDQAESLPSDTNDEPDFRAPGMRESVLQDWLELDPKKTVERGQLWRLLSCAFCHDRLGVWHILFNMLFLYWFGTRLERMYGSREFLLFYLAAALCSSLAYVALAYYTGNFVPAIGASGAVMGVMMLYVIYYPYETFLLFWCIPVPLWILLSLYVIYDLHPVLLALAGDKIFSQVAHAGHLGGLTFGFLYWKFGLRLESVFGKRWKLTRPRKAVRFREPVVLSFPRPDDFSERVDEVLKKISEQGKESLTDEERDILIQASARYRGKNQE